MTKVNYQCTKEHALKRFEANYVPVTESGCWLWTGSSRKGYGRLRYQSKMLGAHRFSYLMFKGEIPKGLFVCHRCDVTECVNPDHLFLGTNSENLKDAFNKGRLSSKKGILNNANKYTTEQIASFKKVLADNPSKSVAYLANRLSIPRTTLSALKHNYRWK